jgi:hypothetical protein
MDTRRARHARSLLILAAGLLALPGCRGCIRENVVYEHMFNRPDCRPRPCPKECPDFELPPGGPYLTTPGMAPAGPAGGQATGQQISVTREK